MTTTTIPSDIAEKAARLGHSDLAPDADSYVPARRCTTCRAGLMLADLSWQGWAIEHRCADVRAVRRKEGQR